MTPVEGRRRDDVFARLVPQPGPRDQDAADVWRDLDHSAREVLRRAATDPELAASVASPHRRVVADLAHQRAGRGPLDVVVPLVTGLLVLSTLWGFGRAVFPADAATWLAIGLLAGPVAVAAGLRRVAGRRRAASAVERTLTTG